jgi:hypothetical protein
LQPFSTLKPEKKKMNLVDTLKNWSLTNTFYMQELPYKLILRSEQRRGRKSAHLDVFQERKTNMLQVQRRTCFILLLQ